MEFETTILYMPGKTNFLSDYMCRALGTTEEGKESVVVHTLIAAGRCSDHLNDDDIEDMRAAFENVPHRKQDGIIMCDKSPLRDAIERVFVLVHDDPLAGHTGVERTLHRVKSVVTWPSVDADIRKLCRDCPLCQKLRARNVRTTTLAELPARLLHEGWYVDFSGPFPIWTVHNGRVGQIQPLGHAVRNRRRNRYDSRPEDLGGHYDARHNTTFSNVGWRTLVQSRNFRENVPYTQDQAPYHSVSKKMSTKNILIPCHAHGGCQTCCPHGIPGCGEGRL
jgi:hypothetical protein